MTTSLNISILVVGFISLLITFPGCMFILVVNMLDWMKNKKLDISDQLISGISLFIVFHRAFFVSVDYIGFTYGYHHLLRNNQSCNILYFSLIFCTLLFCTLLAIHFCLKIVNINHKCYIFIQRGFPKLFPWILFPSIAASILISSPAAQNSARQYENLTEALQNYSYSILDFSLYIAFSFLCFLLFFSSVFNIVLSLQRHIKQIHSNTVEFRTQIVEAHISAMKTVIALFAFNIFYFALLVFLTTAHLYPQWMSGLPFLYALCHVLGLHILIRGSRKLQKKLNTLWLC
ncbi:hypothetical protein GDO78_018600, partial [Eleutherodactylus coqui]